VKILFVSHEIGYTFGVYLDVIGSALVERGHEVHVLNCAPGGPPVSSDEYVDGVWVHRRRHLRPRGTTRVRQLPVVGDALRALSAPEEPAWTSPVTRLNAALTNVLEYRRLGFDVDVIEAPEHLAEGLGFGMLQWRPIVVELHGPLILDVPHWGYEPGRHLRISDQLERLSARTATLTLAPSRFIATELAAKGWVGARDACVVPHAIDVERWAHVPPPTATGPVVLAVGGITPAKGADVLVRAAALLTPSIPGLEVVFVGSSVTLANGRSSVDEIAELAGSLGVSCRFVGPVPRDELADWYGRARVVAVASHHESFSLVGLEAMASGRPIVCSLSTGIAELASDSSEAVTVVPTSSHGALARALEPFLRDPERAAIAGAEARAIAVRRCSPAVVAAQKEAVYRAAIDKWERRRAARTRAARTR
jgi:glycogen(starch) synthase